MQIAEMVTQCFNGLNVYGKQAGQIGDTVKLFLFVLADYPADAIYPAFKVFLERNSRMPTPADIAAIIRRGNKPPLEVAVYTALIQKRERTSFADGITRGNGLTVAEDEYIKDYETEALGLHK